MKKVIKLTESDLAKIVSRVISEQEDSGNGDQYITQMAKIIFPNLKIIEGSVFLGDKLVFRSDSEKCVESFLYGMSMAKTLH